MSMGLGIGIKPSYAGASNCEDQASPTSSERSLDWQSPPDPYRHHLLPDVDEEAPFVFPTRDYFGMAGHAPMEYEGWKHNGTAAGNLQGAVGQVEEGFSPTMSIHFDYGIPPDRNRLDGCMASSQVRHGGSPKGLAINIPCSSHLPNHHTQQQVQPYLPLLCQPASFSLLTQKSPTNIVPQSAPANTGSFPIPIQVTQQHIRTRSVQGEPPSAMLFSPFGEELGEVPGPAGFSQSLNGTRGYRRQAGNMGPPAIPAAPILDPSDPSTWARRGFIDLTTAGASNPLPFNPVPISASHATSPHSLPTNLNSLHQQQTASPSELMGQSMSAALSDDSPTTVSPGIYQLGFSLPAYPPSLKRHISSLNPPVSAHLNPTANMTSNTGLAKSPDMANGNNVRLSAIIQTKQDRRQSISASPYPHSAQSPRQRPGVLNVSDNVGGSGSWTGMNGGALRMIGCSSRGSEGGSSAVDVGNVDGGERKQNGHLSS